MARHVGGGELRCAAAGAPGRGGPRRAQVRPCTLSVAACRPTRASRGQLPGDRSDRLSLTELSLACLGQRVFSERGQLSGRPVGGDGADRALEGSARSQAPVCSQFPGDGRRLAWRVSGAGGTGQERLAAPFSADGW